MSGYSGSTCQRAERSRGKQEGVKRLVGTAGGAGVPLPAEVRIKCNDLAIEQEGRPEKKR